MKIFSEIKVGDEFFSTCSISEKELTEYFNFSRVKNAFLEDMQTTKQKLISGRAILSRMEGEFTRLSQIYGNDIILIGTDGDSEWENRNTQPGRKKDRAYSLELVGSTPKGPAKTDVRPLRQPQSVKCV